MMKNEQGFTIMELVIVLGIVVILMGVTFTSSTYLLSKQADYTTDEIQDNLRDGFLAYYTIKGKYPLNATDYTEGTMYTDIDEAKVKEIMNEISDVTGMLITKRYDHSTMRIDIDYRDSYIVKISVVKR